LREDLANVAQDGLQLLILLPLPPEHWYYRYTPWCPALHQTFILATPWRWRFQTHQKLSVSQSLKYFFISKFTKGFQCVSFFFSRPFLWHKI
jgi:hypothetical protein